VREDEPDFLTSLNDTLTCGFGASLLLFFVFALLVIFEDVPSGDASAAQTRKQAVGFGTNIEELAQRSQLYVRIAAESEEFINALEVSRPSGWVLRSMNMASTKLFVRTFQIDGATGSYVFGLKDAAGHAGERYWMVAFLGGTPLTDLDPPARYALGTPQLFTLNISASLPVRFEQGP